MTRGFLLCADETHPAGATLRLLLPPQHLHNQCAKNTPDNTDEQLEQNNVDRHCYTSLPCRIRLVIEYLFVGKSHHAHFRANEKARCVSRAFQTFVFIPF